MAYINDGVFFVRGTFARVNKQGIVISKYSNVPNCHVLLKITEDIVDYNDDTTLLDTAQGSYYTYSYYITYICWNHRWLHWIDAI